MNNNLQNSRFIFAGENDPHYPIRGLTDLISLKNLCREKIDCLNQEIENNKLDQCEDQTEKFNLQNKVRHLTGQQQKFVKLLEAVEADLDSILKSAAETL